MPLELDVQNLLLPNTIDRGGRTVIAIRDALVAKGWIVAGSGSGTVGATFQNMGQTAGPYDVFTASPAWKTGLNPGVPDLWNHTSGNPNSISHRAAWIRLREPSPSTREFVFQRWSSTDSTIVSGYMTIQMSHTGFTNNNASAASPPTGSNTYTAGTNVVWFDNTTNTEFVLNVLVSDSARGGNVWPFVVMHYSITGAGDAAGGLIYESLVNTDATDTEPWVFKVGTGGSRAQETPTNSNQQNWRARRQSDLVLELMQAVVYTPANGSVPGTAWLNTPLQDGKRRALPMLFAGSDESWKGRAEHLRFPAINRNYPHTLNLATASPYVFWGNLLVPWATGIVPAVS